MCMRAFLKSHFHSSSEFIGNVSNVLSVVRLRLVSFCVPNVDALSFLVVRLKSRSLLLRSLAVDENVDGPSRSSSVSSFRNGAVSWFDWLSHVVSPVFAANDDDRLLRSCFFFARLAVAIGISLLLDDGMIDGGIIRSFVGELAVKNAFRLCWLNAPVFDVNWLL